MLQFECKNCHQVFQLDGDVTFCPYCGNRIDDSSSNPNVIEKDPNIDLAHAIDSIWGEGARLKEAFSKSFSECIYLVNSFGTTCVRDCFPDLDLSGYSTNYAFIKQSNNRKTLITRMDNFLESLDRTIDQLDENIPEEVTHNLEVVIKEVESAVNNLYEFIGQDCSLAMDGFFSDENYEARIRYAPAQLRSLYDLLLEAYSKYKKCVADNNMFAAFSSTSNYGMRLDYWRSRWSTLYYKGSGAVIEEPPEFEEVIAHMEQSNAMKYQGLLDEDFIPHVDAFWYGLEMLCEFIDHYVVINCDAEYFRINDEEKLKLLHTISNINFSVSEEQLKALLDFKGQIERKNAGIEN